MQQREGEFAKVTLSSAVGREIVEAADLLLALEETDLLPEHGSADGNASTLKAVNSFSEVDTANKRRTCPYVRTNKQYTATG